MAEEKKLSDKAVQHAWDNLVEISEHEATKAWDKLFASCEGKMTGVALDRLFEFKNNFLQFWADGYRSGATFALGLGQKKEKGDGRLQQRDVSPGGSGAPPCDPKRSGSGD